MPSVNETILTDGIHDVHIDVHNFVHHDRDPTTGKKEDDGALIYFHEGREFSMAEGSNYGRKI